MEEKKKSKPSAVQVRLHQHFVTIKTPGFPGVPSIDVKVLIQPSSNKRSSKSLWMQMTATSMTYLSAAVRAEVASGATHKEHPSAKHGQAPVGEPGVSRVYTGRLKGQYRYTFAHSITSKNRMFTFSADDDEAAKDAVKRIKSSTPVDPPMRHRDVRSYFFKSQPSSSSVDTNSGRGSAEAHSDEDAVTDQDD